MKKRGYKKENTKSGNKERKKNEKAQKYCKNGTTGRTSIISICTIIKRGTIITTTYR